MVALQFKPAIRAEVIRDPNVMSGDPVVRGTRVLAEQILLYLREGWTSEAIFAEYPSLPIDGIDAVKAWADIEFGSDWIDQPSGAYSH